MATAYYGGYAVFGLAVKVQHTLSPSAQQVNSFFGISGSSLVYGGTRGRAFFVSGVLVAADLAALATAESTLLSYDDGIARTLTDTWGRQWPNVVFRGQYQADPSGPQYLAGSAGWGLPYKAVFHGLT
jgi:hypothetical protein